MPADDDTGAAAAADYDLIPHRVAWFGGSDRPVDGGTVFRRPPANDTGGEVSS